VIRRLRRAANVLRTPRAAVAAALLGALLTLPSIFTGFATDDHNFRMLFQGAHALPELDRPPWEVFSFYADRGPENQTALLNRGLLPWYVGETFHAAFFRPLTSLSHYIDHRLFGDTAWPMHLHSIALFAALVLACGALYRRVHGAGWIAGIAVLLYALDDGRGMNTGWLSGRNALLTTLFGVLTLWAHIAWRQGTLRAGLLIAPLAWALALASGEAGLAAAAYIAAYALCLDRAPWPARLRSLLPYVPVFLLWAVLYRGLGYGVQGSNGYADPLGDPVRFLWSAAAHAPVLLFGQFGLPDSALYNFLPAPWHAVYWLVAAVFVAGVLLLLFPLLRARAEAHFWMLGMLGALLPASATLPLDRLLTLVAVGAAPLLAMLLIELRAVADSMRESAWRRPARVALYSLASVHLVLAPMLLVASSTAIGLIERANQAANASLPMDAGLMDDTLILCTAPSDLLAVGTPIVRSSLRQPVPRHTLLLSAGNGEVRFRREDAHTLVVTTPDDYLNTPWANLFRQPDAEPLQNGWTRHLPGVEITVLVASPGGAPHTTRFRFTRSLEDPALRWFGWAGSAFAPFEVPAVGEEVVVAAHSPLSLAGSAPQPRQSTAHHR